MSDIIIAAIISLLGSGIGALAGILISARLINYRLSLLEERVNKHNSIIERTYALEEKMTVTDYRLSNMESEVKEQHEQPSV